MKWTKEELEKLKANYPSMGFRSCDLFPYRTPASVIRKAELLRLKVDRKIREDGKEDRIGYLDIEASQLCADFGICYSWYIKEQGTDHYDYSYVTREELLDGTLDKRVVYELIEAMNKYTLIYTYYGSRFDIPFLRTRALVHNLKFIPRGEVQHRDLYYLARRVLKLSSNRLENVCRILGIEGKTHIDQRFWVLANTGNKEAIEYICDHNKADVDILELAHLRLAEFESMGRRFM